MEKGWEPLPLSMMCIFWRLFPHLQSPGLTLCTRIYEYNPILIFYAHTGLNLETKWRRDKHGKSRLVLRLDNIFRIYISYNFYKILKYCSQSLSFFRRVL